MAAAGITAAAPTGTHAGEQKAEGTALEDRADSSSGDLGEIEGSPGDLHVKLFTQVPSGTLPSGEACQSSFPHPSSPSDWQGRARSGAEGGARVCLSCVTEVRQAWMRVQAGAWDQFPPKTQEAGN